MRRAILTLLCLVGMILATGARSDNTLNQGTAVETYSGAGAQSNNNITFPNAKSVAQLPYTLQSTPGPAPGIFSPNVTNPANLLWDAFQNFKRSTGSRETLITGRILRQQAKGIEEKYEGIYVRFSPTPDFSRVATTQKTLDQFGGQ